MIRNNVDKEITAMTLNRTQLQLIKEKIEFLNENGVEISPTFSRYLAMTLSEKAQIKVLNKMINELVA